KPDVAVPSADIEGWLSEAAGPFRAPPARPRRELFAAAPETVVGVHGRATARFEPLEESAREPAADERLEGFADRLISEGGSGASPLPAAAPEPPQRARPPAQVEPTPPPRLPLLAAETTQQGLGVPTPALSTRPGFAAVTLPVSPPPRVARDVLTDVTPAVRDASGALPAGADGVPEPLAPQSAEPAIVVPAPTSAPRIPVPLPPDPAEQRPVAGEILSRAPTAKTVPSVGEGVKRLTDLGIGPGGATASAEDRSTQGPTAGEVVSGPAKPEDPRPVRKIILDPDIPEDDEDENAAGRWKKPVGVALGLALAVVVVGVALKKTGHRHRAEQVETAEAAAKPGVAPTMDVDAAIATVADAAAVATSAAPAATPRPATAKHLGASGAAAPVMEERTADPKVARALPTEFPQLLAACRQAFTEKRAKDAEIACIAAKDANPDSPDACALLGHALFNRKKRREALQWAERAVALDPKHADAYVIIGGVKQAADDAPAAKAAYQKYLELAPNGQYAADLRAIVDSL
ncbi:MAG TPA: hypothetical protein VK989_02855, partial [Polyangia bacterium]|nr:hypothetical protein [Polyangia bacterium]